MAHWALSRRKLLFLLGTLAATAQLRPAGARARQRASAIIKKPIPSSSELLPVIGMGSSRTFDVGADQVLRDQRLEVLLAFFCDGGAVIDSSPMYGSSEQVIGYCLRRIAKPTSLYSATKVWTDGQRQSVGQMEASARLWGVDQFDLMQIHNLRDWRAHLETLTEWKAQGRVRYIGITTSHGRLHRAFEQIMSEHALDFVQLSYNILDREAEQRLLPLAAERGQAVMANRPFRRGVLFNQIAGKPLPEWAVEIDCANWAQFFLKFIVSHPAVTCAIPATSRVNHMTENMGAGFGPLPDAEMRIRMVHYVEGL